MPLLALKLLLATAASLLVQAGARRARRAARVGRPETA